MILEDVVTTEVAADELELSLVDELFNFDFIQRIDNPQIQILIIKAFEVVAVLFVLIILCKLTDIITKMIKRKMEKRNRDKTLTKTVYHIVNKVIKALLIVAAISCLGIDTSSVVGLFTAAGLGVGLAIQGALSNFAGGFLILFMRPFKVDDYIEAQDVSGTVEDIHLFYTILRTPDNKEIQVPNGNLISGNIINYSAKPTRRLDITVDIDYEENFLKVEELIKELLLSHALILKDPSPVVRVSEWADSSIKLTVRCWVNNSDYWTVKFDLLEQIYIMLNENNVKIPYNQLEISYRKALEEEKNEEK